MKVSAVNSPAVKEKTEELKKSSEKAADAAKAKDAEPNPRKKDLVMVEGRNVRQTVQQKRAAEKEKLETKMATKAKLEKAKNPAAEPAYVVAVSKRELSEEELAEKKGYSPSELRMKSKQLLESPSLPSDQREVLSEILSKEEK